MIVDPHIVMENAQVNILGEDYLGRLERLYKLKQLMISEGMTTMTRFAYKIPTYFST